MSKKKWGHWYEATPIEKTEAELEAMAKSMNVTVQQMKEAGGDLKKRKMVQNDLFNVIIDRRPTFDGQTEMIVLSIRRLDRAPHHDWRDFQRIKNELVGKEYEAVELYPAESRLVDTANQYWLFCLQDPEMRFPFGFAERLVNDESVGGAIQRKRSNSDEQE